MRLNKFYKNAVLVLIGPIMLSTLSCTDHDLPVGSTIKPKGPKPAFAPDMHDGR